MSKSKALYEGLESLMKKVISGAKADVERVSKFVKPSEIETPKQLTADQAEMALSKAMDVKEESFRKGIINIASAEVENVAASMQDNLTQSFINNGKFTDKMKSRLKPYFNDAEIADIEIQGMDFWKAKSLKPVISNKMKARRLNEINTELYADVASMYGDNMTRIDAQINNIKGDDIDVAIEKSKILYNHRAVAKKIMIGEGQEKATSIKQAWNKTIPTLKTKLGQLKKYADEKGWTEVSDRITGTYKFMESIDGLNARGNNILRSLSSRWGKYDADTQRLMMQLHDSDKVDLVPYNKMGSLATDMIEVDDTLRQALGLDMEQAKLINQTKNAFRFLQKTASEYDQGIYTSSFLKSDRIMGDIDDIPYDRVLYRDERFNTSFVNDMGPEYRHLMPTKEHQAVIDSSLKIKIDDPDYEVTRYSKYQKARVEGSQLANDISKQEIMSEALESYRKSYLNAMAKRIGDNHLDRLEGDFSAFAPLRGGSQVYKDFPLLEDLRKHWNDIHTFQEKRTESLVGDVFNAAMSATKVVLLMPARLALFNMMQPVMNNITKDPWSVLKNQFKETGVLFDVVFSKGNLARARDRNLKREKDPFRRYIKERYFKEYYPNLTSNIMDMEGEALGSKIKKVMNMATAMYQSTDLYTRFVSIDACVDTLEKSVAKHSKFRGSNPQEFVKRVSKDIRLDVFDNPIEREQMMNALLGYANNKNVGLEELGFQYAKNSTELEIFNYSKYGRPAVLDKAKKNTIAAHALTFTSWPMYYTAIINNAIKAAGAGDYRPVGYLAAMATGWYFGMSALSEVEDDTIAGLARYGMFRTPVISPIMGLVQMPSRGLGLVQPAIDLMTYPTVAVFSKINDDMTSQGDYFDFMKRDIEKRLEQMPLYKRSGEAGQYLEDVLELMNL